MRLRAGRHALWFDVVGEKETLLDGRRVEKPTLLFVHGGGGNHAAARPWANRFSDIAQCILLDLPGHGRSSRGVEADWTLPGWADAIVDFCDALAIRKPIVHGGSMGGFIAQSLAIRHPGFCAGLLLIATSARRNTDLIAARFAELGGAEAAAIYTRSLAGHDAEAFAAFMRVCMPLYSVKHGANTLKALARFSLFGASEREALAWFSRPGGELETFDHRGALQNVTAPTLVISGRQDPMCPHEAGQELAESFPPGVARFEVLDQCSHLINEDQPETYVRLVREFIDTVGGNR